MKLPEYFLCVEETKVMTLLNYFNDVRTFLNLEHDSCVAVYGGSESSGISCKIS